MCFYARPQCFGSSGIGMHQHTYLRFRTAQWLPEREQGP